MDSRSTARLPIALTIAGSDSGAGAGIQADLKTFAANGVYSATVLTLVTAQSTSAVDAVELLSPQLVRQQLETVAADFHIGAVKTGALGSSALIAEAAAGIARHRLPNVVVDPVMVSKHGHRLLAPDAVETLQQTLIPLADVVTPNLAEACLLAGMAQGDSRAWMVEAGQAILSLGCRAVVVKGGHRSDDAADLLLTTTDQVWLEGPRVESRHTHGTGCSYSAALAAGLLTGLDLAAACRSAKAYVARGIAAAKIYGRGINPINHFWKTN